MNNIMKIMKRSGIMKRSSLLVAATILAVAVIVPAPVDAAGMLIAEGGFGGVLEIEEHTAEVTINNGVAVTHVTQVFRNTENRQVEALYLFPVPKGASVANFSMWIGGKEMVGEVVEKKRAREIYNSYKRRRRDPGLLEQVDYKNFEMRIFPIAPRAEQKVQITYYQELDFDHDWATYVYPLATAPRPGLNARTRGKFGLTMHVKSQVPIKKLESPSHGEEFVVVRHTDSYYEASLETDNGDPDRPLNVVILSDGMTEQSERQELLALIQTRRSNTRVFCIGVGNEVNRPLLSQLAEDAGGLASFLSRGDDFARQAQAFRRKLLRPAAADVKITFEGTDVYDVEPKQLPNLYHGMPVRLYGRYRDGGPVTVRVQAEVNGAPFEQTVSLELSANDPANPEIERMWAWRKVNRLLKEADRTGSRAAVIDQIVRLGEGYSIVTEYTSFLVLENDAEYQRWQIERRNLLRVKRDRREQQRLRAELERLREQALADLGPADAPNVQKPRRTVGPQTNVRPAPVQPSPAPITPPTRRSRDLDFRPSRPGGGAFDPLSGGIALALAGLGFAARRRRRSQKLPGKGVA